MQGSDLSNKRGFEAPEVQQSSSNKKTKVETGGGAKNLKSYVQILGTDASDCCPSVLVFTGGTRFVFNAGDGLQRFCTQHQIKLGKMEHLFLTRLEAETVGGLLGMYLTLSDSGIKSLFVHGPPGLSRFASAGGAFCDGKTSSDLIPMEYDINSPQTIRENNITIKPILCLAQSEPTAEDQSQEPRNKKEAFGHDCSISYLLRFPDEPGKLDAAKAKALGVPPGPLFGQLKNGHAVTIPGGKTIQPTECVDSAEVGQIVAILDCPSIEHLHNLVSHKALQFMPPRAKSKASSSDQKEQLDINFVIHLSPPAVLCDRRYVEMCKGIAGKADHLVVASSLSPEQIIFPSSAMMLQKLSEIDKNFFEVPYAVVHKDPSRTSLGMQELLKHGWDHWKELKAASDDQSGNSEGAKLGTISPALILNKFGLAPARYSGLDWTTYNDEDYFQPGVTTQATTMSNLPEASDDAVPDWLRDIGRDKAEVVMLGTAASVPGKYRNVSSIYVDLFSRGGILLDCGEGTLGQMLRKYGDDAWSKLEKLKGVWISHMHADHHLGLLRLLSHRRKAKFKGSDGEDLKPLTVIGPPPLRKWLNTFKTLEDVSFDFVENSLLKHSKKWVGVDSTAVLEGKLAADLQVDISTVDVRHSCREACGVVVTDLREPAWKIVYSGDTRPCQELVSAGDGATLLIHEASFEDGLERDAKIKQHSTTGEAIRIGHQMKACRILLTHFSQRYAKAPVLSTIKDSDRTMVAFDMMTLNLADLPNLPRLLRPVAELCEKEGWRPED